MFSYLDTFFWNDGVPQFRTGVAAHDTYKPYCLEDLFARLGS